MSNRIDDALDRLYEALTPVLPGRVWPFPNDEPLGVSIGVPTITPSGGAAIEAEFPVTVRYDGAERAQIAGINDLVARCWDACEALARCTPAGARPVDGAAGLTVVLTVRLHIAARTLCAPATSQSFVPPEPITV